MTDNDFDPGHAPVATQPPGARVEPSPDPTKVVSVPLTTPSGRDPSATNGHGVGAPQSRSAVGGTTSSPPSIGDPPKPKEHAAGEKSIRDLIGEECERFSHLDDTKVAWRVLASVKGMDDEARHLLLPLVVGEVGRVRRQPVRTDERRAFGRGNPVEVVGHLTPELRQLANQRLKFAGLVTTWGEVTREQHQERIDWFEQHIAGCERTLSYHRQMLTMIEAAGADCLNDLLEEAA